MVVCMKYRTNIIANKRFYIKVHEIQFEEISYVLEILTWKSHLKNEGAKPPEAENKNSLQVHRAHVWTQNRTPTKENTPTRPNMQSSEDGSDIDNVAKRARPSTTIDLTSEPQCKQTLSAGRDSGNKSVNPVSTNIDPDASNCTEKESYAMMAAREGPWTDAHGKENGLQTQSSCRTVHALMILIPRLINRGRHHPDYAISIWYTCAD